jgi:hypothetical protein
MGAMRLTADYVHPTPLGGRCRVRIYLPEEERDAPVVVCTEPRNNPGMSVTNAAERIAGEVIHGHRLRTPLVWIEHYEHGVRGTPEDPQTFDLVLFSHYEVEKLGPYLGSARRRIGEPSWKPLDRASVETLIGGPLEEA